jgi:hypothetical protein
VALSKFVLTASSGFKIASTTCGTSLAANAHCTANLVFTPASVGSTLGELSITSSELPATEVVPLSGTGYDFSSEISGSASQTVASGQTATYTLSVRPEGGSDGTFTFQCGSLPEYAACAFNPSNLSVASIVSGQVLVQISTSRSSAKLQPPAWRWTALPISFGLLMVPLVARRRRGLWLGLLLVLGLAGMSGCASVGGGAGSTPPPSTAHNAAPGTYKVPVTITSNGVQHTVNLTLVVN